MIGVIVATFLFLFGSVTSGSAITWSYSGAYSSPFNQLTEIVSVGSNSYLLGGSHLSAGDNVIGHYLYTEDSGWVSSNYRLYNDGVVYDEIENSSFVFNRVGNIKVGAGWVYRDSSGVTKTEVASNCARSFERAIGISFSPTGVRVDAGGSTTKSLSYSGKALAGIWGGSVVATGGTDVAFECSTSDGVAVCGSEIQVGTFSFQSVFPTSYLLSLSCSGSVGSYCDFNFDNMTVLYRDEADGSCSGSLPPLPTPTPLMGTRVYGTVKNPTYGNCCPASVRLDKDVTGSGYTIGTDTDTTTYDYCNWEMAATEQGLSRIRTVASGAFTFSTPTVPSWSSSWPAGSSIGQTQPTLVEWNNPPNEAGSIDFKMDCPTPTPTPIVVNSKCQAAGFCQVGFGEERESSGTSTDLPVSYAKYDQFWAPYSGAVNGIIVKGGNYGGADRAMTCKVTNGDNTVDISTGISTANFRDSDGVAWRGINFGSSQFALQSGQQYRLYCKSEDPWSIDNMVYWNYYGPAGETDGKNYVICSCPTADLPAKTCRVAVGTTTVAGGESQTITVWGTGNTNPGTETVRVWVEGIGGSALAPTPIGTQATYVDVANGKYYYQVGQCGSIDGAECTTTATVGGLLEGNYYTHCDLATEPPLTKCTGNPFCPVNGGSGGSCSGWNSCSSNDYAEFSVNGAPVFSDLIIKNSVGTTVVAE